MRATKTYDTRRGEGQFELIEPRPGSQAAGVICKVTALHRALFVTAHYITIEYVMRLVAGPRGDPEVAVESARWEQHTRIYFNTPILL